MLTIFSALFAAASTCAIAAAVAGTYMHFENARAFPAGTRPYARTSIWNTPISSRPKLLPNSAAIVAAQFPGGENPTPVRAMEAGKFDYTHPRFFATSTDPLVELRCTKFCGAPDNGGVPKAIRIPARARPAGGTDAHLFIVEPDGREIDFWAVYGSPGSDTTWDAPHNLQRRNWQNGDVLGAENVANCGPFLNGLGRMEIGPASTAAGFCENGGIVTAAELLAGRIDHAIFVSAQCAVGAQFPVQRTGSTNQCTSGVGPPLGGREWYDVPCAVTQAESRLRPWEKAILCALNVYGGYFGDNGGSDRAHFTGGVAPLLDSEEPWRDYEGPSYTSPFAALAAQGWYMVRIPDVGAGQPGMRWLGADPWNPPGVNFAAHIHWLAPCSAQRTC